MAKEAKSEKSTLERLVPILLLASIVLAFAVGVLWQKVTTLEQVSSGVAGAKVADAQDAPEAPPAPPNGKLSAEQAERVPTVSDDDHKRGSGTVYVIEYSDLECPFCKQFHSTLQDVMDEYEGKVVWVYRHFPLDMLHPKARVEAAATECAYEQGGNEAFWALTDKIYEVTPANNGLDLDDLPKLATEVGLDGAALQECIDSGKYDDKVEEQYQGGVAAGVTGTPGNFIIAENGDVWAMPGALPANSLAEIIEEALGN